MPRSTSLPPSSWSWRTVAPGAGLAASILAALVVSSCGGADPDEIRAFAVHDSAGVRIASNPGPEWASEVERWRLREVVRVGGAEGPEETLFQRPGQAVPDGEGGILIVEGGEAAIRRYGPGGAFLGRIGRAGDGPGEFRQPTGFTRHGDTLLVFDPGLMRISRFSERGALLDTRPVSLEFRTHGVPSELVPLDDGRLLAFAGAGCSMPAPDDRRARVRMSVFEPNPSGDGTLRLDGPVSSWVQNSVIGIYGENFCSSIPSLAGHGVPRAIGPHGRGAVAPGGAYEIHVFSVRGTDGWSGGALGAFPPPELLIRRDLEPTPVTASDREAYEDFVLPEDPEAAAMRSAIRTALDTTRVPQHYPQIAALHWDDAGWLWVLRGRPWHPPNDAHAAGPRSMDVYDPAGRQLAEIELPPSVTVLLIHQDRIWGIERDALGVPTLVAWEVER